MAKEIVITFAKDVPCYGTVFCKLPENIDASDIEAVQAWLKENAEGLADDSVYEPEWQYEDGLRIIDARFESENPSDAMDVTWIFTDTEYVGSLPKYDVGTLAVEVVSQMEDEIIKSNLSRETVMRLLGLIGKGE